MFAFSHVTFSDAELAVLLSIILHHDTSLLNKQSKQVCIATCAIPQTSTSDAQATPVATQTGVQLCAASGTPQHRSKSMGSSTSCTCPRPHGTWSLTVGGGGSLSSVNGCHITCKYWKADCKLQIPNSYGRVNTRNLTNHGRSKCVQLVRVLDVSALWSGPVSVDLVPQVSSSGSEAVADDLKPRTRIKSLRPPN